MTNTQGNRRGTFAAATVLAALAIACSSGSDLRLTATVDRDTVKLSECLLLTVSVSGTGATNSPRPHLPDFTSFRNLRGSWMQSVRSQPDSVDMHTVSYVCLLQPRRTGLLSIGSAAAELNGTTCTTNPIRIMVVDDKQVRGLPPGSDVHPARVALSAAVDRETAWVGQQVTVSYTLYAESTLFGLTLKHASDYTGFWAEQLFDGWELNWRADSFNQRACKAALVKRVALFPTQPGLLSVGEMTLTGAVAGVGGTLPGAFELFNVSSQARSITVNPLPAAGRPDDFSGGVGDFILDADLGSGSSSNREPLKLDVRIAGTGSISTVGDPQIPALAGALVLSSGSTQQVLHAGGTVTGSRTHSFAIQPRADGRYIVPAITMSFFDPRRGEYYTRTTAPEEFVATGVLSPAADIRCIKYHHGSLADRSVSAWFFGPFYPAGVAVFAVGLLTGKHRRRLDADRGYARRFRSSRLAQQRLSEAARFLAAGGEHEFCAALNRAVVGFIGDRFNIEAFGMTEDQLREELLRHAVEPDTVKGVLAVVSATDAVRFSRAAAQGGLRTALDNARAVIEKLS